MLEQKQYKLSNNILYTEIEQDERLLIVNLNEKTEYRTYSIKGPAVFMFNEILKGKSQSQIINETIKIYSVPKDVLSKDIKDLIHSLKQNGIVEPL